MNKEQIKTRLDKYFEGLTSLEEEEALRSYFNREDIDPELLIYQPIFQYFEEERISEERRKEKEERREEKRQMRIRIIRWASIAAAACLLLFFSVQLLVRQTNGDNSYAYIDGKRYTNMEIIQSQALESLENLAEEDNSILSSQIEMLDSLFE